MKKILFTVSIASLLFACNEKTKKDYHAEHDNFKLEINELKIKLDATEAQLLNVQAELSKFKAKDSTATKAE